MSLNYTGSTHLNIDGRKQNDHVGKLWRVASQNADYGPATFLGIRNRPLFVHLPVGTITYPDKMHCMVFLKRYFTLLAIEFPIAYVSHTVLEAREMIRRSDLSLVAFLDWPSLLPLVNELQQIGRVSRMEQVGCCFYRVRNKNWRTHFLFEL